MSNIEEHLEKFYNGELYTAKQLKQIAEDQKNILLTNKN